MNRLKRFLMRIKNFSPDEGDGDIIPLKLRMAVMIGILVTPPLLVGYFFKIKKRKKEEE